jgi:HPt (histidine-containing phosphotransfer) domain-containing protein
MDHSTFDRDDFLARIGNDRQLLGLLLDALERNAHTWRDEFEQALTSADFPRIRRLAHTAKGAVANFSATASLEAARELERLATTENLQPIRLAVSVLNEKIEQLIESLRALANASCSG